MSEDIKLHYQFMLFHSALPVIGSLVTYRIAEHLQSGPKSTEELASLASISTSRLFQCLRLASYFEVFTFDSDLQKWSNTPNSLLLTSSLSRSLWEWHTQPYVLQLYTHTTRIVASDKDPNIIKNEPTPYETFSQNPDLLSKFKKYKSELLAFSLNEIIENIDIGESQNVLDIGGGDGSLVLGIVKKHSYVKGAILDRHEVGTIANKNISENGLSEKVQFLEGNFLESINEGYDCIVIKQVIHASSDLKAALILENCRKALKEGNKVFLIDQVVDINSEYYATNLAEDNLKLVALGTKERSIEEFEKLLSQSGLRLISVKKVGYLAVIEAVAI